MPAINSKFSFTVKFEAIAVSCGEIFRLFLISSLSFIIDLSSNSASLTEFCPILFYKHLLFFEQLFHRDKQISYNDL